MAAYKTQIVIEDPNRVVLSDLPFKPGDRVEITIEKDVIPQTLAGQKWAKLFEEVDRLPQARRITEEEIAAEIAAYRAGR